MTRRSGTNRDDFVRPGAVTEVTSRYATGIDKWIALELESAYRGALFDLVRWVVAQPPFRAVRGPPSGQLEHG